jgi:hypothetical protein
VISINYAGKVPVPNPFLISARVTTVVLSRIQAFRNVLGCLESYSLLPGNVVETNREKVAAPAFTAAGATVSIRCHEGIKMAPALDMRRGHES